MVVQPIEDFKWLDSEKKEIRYELEKRLSMLIFQIVYKLQEQFTNFKAFPRHILHLSECINVEKVRRMVSRSPKKKPAHPPYKQIVEEALEGEVGTIILKSFEVHSRQRAAKQKPRNVIVSIRNFGLLSSSFSSQDTKPSRFDSHFSMLPPNMQRFPGLSLPRLKRFCQDNVRRLLHISRYNAKLAIIQTNVHHVCSIKMLSALDGRSIS